MRKDPLYKAIASLMVARANCANKPEYAEWFANHTQAAEKLVDDYMPHGSGFDDGTKIDFDRSTPDKLVFYTSFHHMDENGMYDGWSAHEVIVKPSLAFDLDLKVTGRDRNDIKDYIAQAFQECLTIAVEY